ncbi:MAG: hypothetical protein AAF928_21750 [Myxococcota bacterium]
MNDAPTPKPDAGLSALIELLRKKSSEPCEETAAMLRDDLPAPVHALLKAIADHGIYVDLAGTAGGFELTTPEALEDHNAVDEISEHLVTYAIVADDVVNLGSTGGGEEQLLVGWNAEGYRVFRWEYEEEALHLYESFAAFFVYLRNYLAEKCECDRDALADSDLETLLVRLDEWDTYWAAV